MLLKVMLTIKNANWVSFNLIPYDRRVLNNHHFRHTGSPVSAVIFHDA